MSWMLDESMATPPYTPPQPKIKEYLPTHPYNFIGPKGKLQGREVVLQGAEQELPAKCPLICENTIKAEKESNIREAINPKDLLLKNALKLVKNRKIVWFPCAAIKQDGAQFETRIDSAYRRRYWHPDDSFVEELFFREKGIKRTDFMGVKYFFIEWLQNKESQNDRKKLFHLLKTDLALMSCVDFIYLNLYLAGILSKENIQAIYAEHARRVNNDERGATCWWGFSFDECEELSAGTAGDIVFMKSHKDEYHCFFLYKKEKGEWLGISLFNQPEIEPNEEICSCQAQVIYVKDLLNSMPKFEARVFPLNRFLI